MVKSATKTVTQKRLKSHLAFRKKLDAKSLTNTANPNSKHIVGQTPVRGFNKIIGLWRQDIRAETNAERQFLINQKTIKEEQNLEQNKSQFL